MNRNSKNVMDDNLKSKVLNILLLVTSLMGYLEWGDNRHQFLFQMEGEVFYKLFNGPESVLHPLTVLPFIGQLMILFTLFQKRASRRITYFGVAFLGVLMFMVFLTGIASANWKILLSTIPFFVISLLVIRHQRSIKKNIGS
ncbi:hypothetical protein AAGF08_20415 [Algoriphagus sp. SE2]|uniref:hypothetical protein n=1 Tax=Algoriphagus sp. SE2 TaxID=3141536 RepID=UPI0031CDAB1A